MNCIHPNFSEKQETLSEMPKGFRKCKQCQEVFEKRSPLDMFCSPACGSAYKKQKAISKNGLLQPKPTRSSASKSRVLHSNGSTYSEKEVFERIWGTDPRKRVSFVTGRPLPDYHNAYPWYFSHILPKARNRYPMFKYYQRNIVLKTFEEHTEWEHHQYRIKDNPVWGHVFRLQEELKEEYEQHRQLYEAGEVEYYKT